MPTSPSSTMSRLPPSPHGLTQGLAFLGNRLPKTSETGCSICRVQEYTLTTRMVGLWPLLREVQASAQTCPPGVTPFLERIRSTSEVLPAE